MSHVEAGSRQWCLGDQDGVFGYSVTTTVRMYHCPPPSWLQGFDRHQSGGLVGCVRSSVFALEFDVDAGRARCLDLDGRWELLEMRDTLLGLCFLVADASRTA